MKRHHVAAAALFLTAAAWGATFTLIKSILDRIAPEPFICYRFILAGLLLLPFAAARRAITRAILLPAITLGSLVFLGYWMQTRGLMLITPARSAFLTGLYVVMVPFCDWLVYRARVSRAAWIGSLLAVIGTTAMIGGFDTRPSFGDALTVACAVLFAFHVILSARWSARFPAIGLAAIQVFFVGLAAAPFSFSKHTTFTREIVIVILATAIVTTALAFAALMWAQAHVSATEAAVILAFEPVAASLTSIIWYREPITLAFVVGAILILAAMIVSQVSATMRTDGPNPRHQ